MAKRGGLGQRGLDLLISVSPGAGKTEQQESTGQEGSGGKASGTGSTAKAGGSRKSAGGKTTKKSASSGAGKAKTSTSKKSASSGSKKAAVSGTGSKTAQSRKKPASAGKKTESAKTKNTNISTANAYTDAALQRDTLSVNAETDVSKQDVILSAADKKTSVVAADKKSSVSAAADTAAAGSVESANTADIAETASPSESVPSAGEISNEPLMVPVSQIEPNRQQPRRNFDEDSLQELADSIRQFGVIQPLIVQKKEDYYEIIAGERRWRASKIAGLKKLPVIVKEYTPRQVMEISLIENIQREDLNPIEEANAYRRLMEEYHLRQDEVAERVSRSRAAVANSVRLLNLDQRVQDMVVSEMLTTGHARALLALSDPEVQYSTAQRVFDEKLSVREVERMVRQLNAGPAAPAKPAVSDTLRAVYDGMTEQMRASLGTKVSIHPRSPQKGRIEIEYYSADELDRLCALLQNPGSVSENRG